MVRYVIMANHNVIPFPQSREPSESSDAERRGAIRRHPASRASHETPQLSRNQEVTSLLPKLLQRHGRAVIQRVLDDENDTPSARLIYDDDGHDRD